jgi:hypothetical protein
MPMVRDYNRTGRLTQSTTLREFDGGWNVVDSDLNLDTRFAPLFDNWTRAPDGTAQVRYGTRRFADVSEYIPRIVNMTYFRNRIIVVGTNGVIVGVDGTGTVTVFFDDSIAENLPGSPSGWGNTFFASFAEFNSDLIICNGVNKPLIIYSDNATEYLNDLANGSNVNTPTARFVITASRYLIMAGDLTDTDIVHISNVDTSGTHVGDGAPNDAVTIQTGSVVTSGSSVIKGLTWFRNRLIIMFDEVIAIYVLGEYVSSAHIPRLEDVIEHHGAISHRTIAKTFDDALFPDTAGVSALSKALFTGTLQPDRESQLIDPAISGALDHLTTIALEDRTFALFNATDSQYMLFIPNESLPSNTIETEAFVYTNIKKLKVEAWTRMKGWNWVAGCVSQDDRVFLADDGTHIFYYLGKNDVDHNNPAHGDFIDFAETYTDDYAFTDGTGWLVTDAQRASNSYVVTDTGLPVEFDWQLPWGDFGSRQNIKKSKYLHIEATGSAHFTVDWFTNGNLINKSYLGEPYTDGTRFTDGYGFYPFDKTIVNFYNPNLSQQFAGADYGGYGNAGYGQYFGGSVNSGDERLVKWPSKFKIGKFRIHGSSRYDLGVISIGLNYTQGSLGI